MFPILLVKIQQMSDWASICTSIETQNDRQRIGDRHQTIAKAIELTS